VNTTPKPKATKKSNGEVPPSSSPPSSRPSLLLEVVSDGGEEDWVGEDTEEVGDWDEEEDESRGTTGPCRIWCSRALAMTTEAWTRSI
jgi:hypothetical protein